MLNFHVIPEPFITLHRHLPPLVLASYAIVVTYYIKFQEATSYAEQIIYKGIIVLFSFYNNRKTLFKNRVVVVVPRPEMTVFMASQYRWHGARE